ncbi:uncharacterized protein LOC9313856 isoform X2 [Arabidopsis lyrata subsp. lyrata]|uniref:uncharacterized protein LOC9313856 isoform X2 n=1 Tax=Arabidopsis lyrata subsp. lyrata TaxID=81972 RepID=UPI000A29D5D6|nr:uncharacterized protein LOC9313856 isoform X2 [Arabidopsis lyrata subsp. lyrata]|eukprot:XP_020881523.1 uncharacterized protein LOC9313856 isoform X2 [Arabidopsis lyrata subsp. lyrata]
MNEGSSEEVTRTVMEEKPEQQQRGSLEKGRSCKGYLYYSSTLKSKAKNPRCVGIPRTLRQAEASKEGRTLADFYYGCLGYSVYMTDKDSSAIKQHTKTQLPVCVGLEILADRRAASGNTSSVPARVQSRNDSREVPRQQNNKPAPAPAPATATNTENGFLTRFTRNASLVAGGVMKNMKRVGNYVKETVDDSLDPYRKRPK